MGSWGNLKLPGLSSVFDGSVVYRWKNGQILYIGNNQKTAQVAQSWPKRGEKAYFKSESRQARRLRLINHL